MGVQWHRRTHGIRIHEHGDERGREVDEAVLQRRLQRDLSLNDAASRLFGRHDAGGRGRRWRVKLQRHCVGLSIHRRIHATLRTLELSYLGCDRQSADRGRRRRAERRPISAHRPYATRWRVATRRPNSCPHRLPAASLHTAIRPPPTSLFPDYTETQWRCLPRRRSSTTRSRKVGKHSPRAQNTNTPGTLAKQPQPPLSTSSSTSSRPPPRPRSSSRA